MTSFLQNWRRDNPKVPKFSDVRKGQHVRELPDAEWNLGERTNFDRRETRGRWQRFTCNVWKETAAVCLSIWWDAKCNIPIIILQFGEGASLRLMCDAQEVINSNRFTVNIFEWQPLVFCNSIRSFYNKMLLLKRNSFISVNFRNMCDESNVFLPSVQMSNLTKVLSKVLPKRSLLKNHS